MFGETGKLGQLVGGEGRVMAGACAADACAAGRADGGGGEHHEPGAAPRGVPHRPPLCQDAGARASGPCTHGSHILLRTGSGSCFKYAARVLLNLCEAIPAQVSLSGSLWTSLTDGRLLLYGAQGGCLPYVLSIVAALSVENPIVYDRADANNFSAGKADAGSDSDAESAAEDDDAEQVNTLVGNMNLRFLIKAAVAGRARQGEQISSSTARESRSDFVGEGICPSQAHH
jgi:hypothetical protein